ncbi:Elongation factor Tu GTP binding domain family protein [Babesia bovis T2Bo]|uniref:Elongation factor Tu GTP binding domain family protein n=1 Tax=Babesia bovis T2Bo TaxID=484906 RepID=UPI001D3E8107|nr:Elongation factor Tu GTP binding domain family protein [Babesia bovis T2Bo]EDO06901.2 Elongation factor Tu GTP binding domain family protein [Babesia bovis T2Bo]
MALLRHYMSRRTHQRAYSCLYAALNGKYNVCHSNIQNGHCNGRHFSHICRDSYTTNDIRNIGIIAHIDAGKTTLAEALIDLANKREERNIANSSIQLDFMEQEIKRGITIRAACSSFKWNGCHINVIDTPGHTDFSGEVISAMDVIDGCIIVIDGTKGVQAQTRHLNAALPKGMPKIVFINKMDRPGISIDENMASIKKQLRLNPLLINTPQRGKTRDILSTISILDPRECNQGEYQDLLETLTECIANMDEEMADLYLGQGYIPKEIVIKRLSNYVRTGNVTPVLCGSAVTTAGVDQLLDAVCCLLPYPAGISQDPSAEDDGTILYTFKTLRGAQSRIHAFCKVVHGNLVPGMRLHNINLKKMEQAGKIYKIQANTYQERNIIVQGDIAMVSGMHHVRTGHLLSKYAKHGLSDQISALVTKCNAPAKYVCFATFTALNESDNNKLLHAMENIKIEDPTVYYRYDPDALDGLVVGGFGEFHIEIIAEILKDDYGIPVKIGQLKVAYKESPAEKVEASLYTGTDTPEDKTQIGLEIIMEPMEPTMGEQSSDALDNVDGRTGDLFMCEVEHDSAIFLKPDGSEIEPDAATIDANTRDILDNVRQLLSNALAAGPLIGGSMINTRVKIAKIKLLPTSNVAGAKTIASRAMKSIYNKVPIDLFQPIVNVNIMAPSEYVGNITSDLRKERQANVLSVSNEQDDSSTATIVAKAPMKHMLGYTKALRALTNGNATFSITPCGFTRATINEID